MKVNIMKNSTYILKINTALSDSPFYIKIDQEHMSIDSIISEAIDELENVGKPLQSKQLATLYESHQLFNQGRQVSKGNLFTDLKRNVEQIEGRSVEVAEIDMVTHHSGG